MLSRNRHRAVSPNAIDPFDYVDLQDQNNEKFEIFMIKYLQRTWPAKIFWALGFLQLGISVAIFSVDIIVVLMLAPRWQVMVVIWAFLGTLAASIGTLITIRESTWSKLKWGVALNIIGGLASALMIAFDILILVNPYVCVAPGGFCTYLLYTYSRSSSFLAGEVVLGIAFYITAFGFLFLFIKFGYEGVAIFEEIQKEYVPSERDDSANRNGMQPAARAPAVGSGRKAGHNTVVPASMGQNPGNQMPMGYNNMSRVPPSAQNPGNQMPMGYNNMNQYGAGGQPSVFNPQNRGPASSVRPR